MRAHGESVRGRGDVGAAYKSDDICEKHDFAERGEESGMKSPVTRLGRRDALSNDVIEKGFSGG